MASSTNNDVDVLIVGAGPTGLMLALELAAHPEPISFRLIDKARVPASQSRAIIVQPRTLELLKRHGDAIPSKMRSLATTAVGFSLFVDGEPGPRIDLSDLGFDDTAFPLPLWVSQAYLEKEMEAVLLAKGHRVERGVEASEFVEERSAITVTLAKNDEADEERVRSKYVVGCDGAHSTVRHAAGIAFEGAPYLQSFILCDTHIDWTFPPNRLMMFWNKSLLAVFPLMDGTVRLMCSREDLPGEDPERAPTLEDFQKRLLASVPTQSFFPGGGEPMPIPPPRLHDPVWLASFRLHHRVASRYSVGRFLVAGDAAHIHSPAGGQGMNSGIGDAANLGWKLARIVCAERSRTRVSYAAALLASYEGERRRIGQLILQSTDRAFGIANSTHWLVVLLRNAFFRWVVPIVTRSRERRARAFGFMSQLRIRYRRSSIVGNAPGWSGKVRAGDRAPDGSLRVRIAGERWLRELCRGPGYGFVVFAGVGEREAEHHELERAVLRYEEGSRERSEVMMVYSSEPSASETGAVDVEGRLHERYGFTGPGYVLIRPDGHVEYIGTLETLPDLIAWLATSES